MSWEGLKSAVQSVVTANGNGEITGQILQDLINNNIIPQLGADKYIGLAYLNTVPARPENQIFYIANINGVYPYFGNLEIEDEIAIFKYNGISWSKNTLLYYADIKGNYPGTLQDLKNEIDALVFTGVTSYQNLADLPIPVPPEGTPAKVVNDSMDPNNNGYYSVSGGAWVKDSVIAPTRTSDLINDGESGSSFPFVERETGKKIDIIAGILRNAGGTWSFISDADHFGESGLQSVVGNPSGTVTLNFKKTYHKILSFVACPDEVYAMNGVHIGSSVGTGLANIKLFQNKTIGDYIFYDGIQWVSLNGVFTNFVTNPGYVYFEHADNARGSVIVTVTPRDASVYDYRLGSIGDDNMRVSIHNSDGSVYTLAPDTGMRFYVQRNISKQMTTEDSALDFSNIWIMGIMQET